MFSRLALLTATSALLLPTYLAAQPTGAVVSMDVISLEKMCRADGALDLRFGDRVEGRPKAAYVGPALRKLDKDFLPFVEVQLGYSRYSNQLWNFGYSAFFQSNEDAMAAADLLAAKAQALNWIVVGEPEGDDGFYQYSFSTTSEPGDQPASDETTLSIVVEDVAVAVNCQNEALLLLQLEEAMGKMPVGTPRPQLADYIVPQSSFTVADCDDAAKREAFQKEMDGGGKASFSPNWSRANYEEDLANWKIMKLTSSGKTDFESVNEMILALLDNPDSQQSLEDGLAMLEEFGTEMEKLDPQDEGGMCRIMHKFMLKASAAAAPKPGAKGDAVTPQWQATHDVLDREAKRLGVSLDA